jgi:hypothetical protein
MNGNVSLHITNEIGKLKGKDLGVYLRIILKWILKEIGYAVLVWIHLTYDRDQLRVLLNTVMTFRVP